MELVATPLNPIPDDPQVMAVVTADGRTLRAASWKAARRRVKGTVCLLQGRAEFIEKYFETVEDLRRRGFAVVAFDWRGQGGSQREIGNPRKGHVRDFAHYRRDLEAVRDSLLEPMMPKPHFALAHSMGGALALLWAREGVLPFQRLVALTPMLALSMVKHPRAAKLVARALNAVGYAGAFVPGGGPDSITTAPFSGNRLTNDPRRYARNAQAAVALGSGAIGAPTVAWLNAAFRFMARFNEAGFPLQVRVPTLVVAAGADPICATPAIERFAARLKVGNAIVIPGARHEILTERDAVRDEFWAAFDAFIPGTPDFPDALPIPEPRMPRITPLRAFPVPSALPTPSAGEVSERRLVNPAVAGGDH
jgi:lysophospholipase